MTSSYRKNFAAALAMAMLLSGGPADAQRARVSEAKGAPPSDEWRALLQESSDLFFQGKFDGGAAVAKKALELAERERGPGHPSVAASLKVIDGR